MPKSVETSQGGNVTILWNQQVQTDRTIPNNKPDIIIRDNEKGTCTGCNRRKGPDFGRVFLMLNYTEKPQNNLYPKLNGLGDNGQ